MATGRPQPGGGGRGGWGEGRGGGDVYSAALTGSIGYAQNGRADHISYFSGLQHRIYMR